MDIDMGKCERKSQNIEDTLALISDRLGFEL